MSHPPMQESNPFPVGSRVAMRLTDGTPLSLQILKPFLPFTKSLVYLVRPDSPSNGLPPEIILKIFDPRYVDERNPSSKHGLRPRLWTLEAETAAAQYRQEIAEGKRPDDLTVHVVYRDSEAKPYLWEEHFYRYFMASSENEVDAFRRLISLQGTIIPKFYGSGNILPPAHTRSIQPPAVLIEYIRGTTLADYNAAKRPNLPFAIFRPLFDVIRKFKALGVYHGDVSDTNILVSPSEAPVRAVLIDFGRAGVREDGESEEDWTGVWDFYSDAVGLKVALKANGIRHPRFTSRNSFHRKRRERAGRSWRVLHDAFMLQPNSKSEACPIMTFQSPPLFPIAPGGHLEEKGPTQVSPASRSPPSSPVRL